MSKIRILMLDDDNHTPCYVLENSYWSDANSLMKNVLCKPHTLEYEIKEIRLIELNTGLYYEDMSAEEMFDKVDDYRINKPSGFGLTEDEYEKRLKAFNFLWETPEEVLYVW